MKKIFQCLFIIFISCQAFVAAGQDSVYLQRLPDLSATKFNYIESRQPNSIIKEAVTRFPGQHSVIFLSGNNSMEKQYSAMYLAHKVGMPVYKIPLSSVLSAGITETKRKLLYVFETAKEKRWVLFFDEAEALFGRRNPVKDAHDRYDSPEAAYFYQLVEQYRGALILSITATNNINPWIFKKYIRFHIP